MSHLQHDQDQLARPLRTNADVADPSTSSTVIATRRFGRTMTGDASGFSINGRRTRFWMALPAELVLAYQPTRHFAWELSAAALSQLRRDDFGIDGLGAAYRSPVVAGLLSLRGVALRLW